MKTLDGARSIWAETLRHTGSLSSLQRSVKHSGTASPCIRGSRSLCWKIFLLFETTTPTDWRASLAQSRQEYSKWSDEFLKFNRHPEMLASVDVDPLADDPNSPWNTVRQDEIVRAEIVQDVQRLPDEPIYHELSIQDMIVDILFVYCKLHPNDGGYRQGMHELLAPLVYVLEQDAVDPSTAKTQDTNDETIIDVLDYTKIEHDAFALFSKIMESASAFYEIREPISKSGDASTTQDAVETSAIVERSKIIHEVYLAKVDPELSEHLREVEILPQIFLIRWIRLLLGREFPFHQLLALWDALFAVDPSLGLIDYICVAMLLRIRWNLLEADYSRSLQLLLKYPSPDGEYGPNTLVDDAVYLKSHLQASGGASLVLKYSGKLPSNAPSKTGRPTALSMRSAMSQQRIRSPLSSTAKFIQQQGGMEAIFQGAAKNVLERGEKLGINQAVRDAVGEIKKNMQGLNDVRNPPQAVSDGSAAGIIAALERRNLLLAGMLDETIVNLKLLATSSLDDKEKVLELVETAAAKVQFVKVHLEDSTIDLPELVQPTPFEDGVIADSVLEETFESDNKSPIVAKAVAAADGIPDLDTKSEGKPDVEVARVKDVEAPQLTGTAATPSVSSPESKAAVKESSQVNDGKTEPDDRGQGQGQQDGSLDVKEHRPQPIPTRSTLAQSSFAWMLEPDEPVSHSTPSSQPQSPTGGKSNDKFANRAKRTSTNASRERNAFLFGDVVAESDGAGQPVTEDIFGLKPIAKKEKGASSP